MDGKRGVRRGGRREGRMMTEEEGNRKDVITLSAAEQDL